MVTGITLGDFRTEHEAKERIKDQKKRLNYVIRLNKLKVNASKFKFYIEKPKREKWMGIPVYPYTAYFNTPEDNYNWIFLT